MTDQRQSRSHLPELRTDSRLDQEAYHRAYPSPMAAVTAPLTSPTRNAGYDHRSTSPVRQTRNNDYNYQPSSPNRQTYAPSQATLVAAPIIEKDLYPMQPVNPNPAPQRDLEKQVEPTPRLERPATGPDQVHIRSNDPDTDSIYVPKKHMRALALKNHFLAFVGELVGTTLFMYFALAATNVANLPATTVTGVTTVSAITGEATTVLNTSSLLYIALAFGFSLAICAWIFFRVSGGLFNPAVSLGLLLVGVITPVRAILLTIAQCAGAIAGAGFVQLTLPGDLNATTRLAPGTSVVQGLFIEMFCTSLLMFAVLFLAAEKSKATFLAPIGIGLALFVGELVGVLYTGGSLNPARSLGPNVILASFSKDHWIYWLGPFMGATLAAVFYRLIKLMHFETVVPGQDDDGSAALLQQQAGSAAIAGNAGMLSGHKNDASRRHGVSLGP